METLPNEVKRILLEHLTYDQQKSISRVSKIWAYLVLSIKRGIPKSCTYLKKIISEEFENIDVDISGNLIGVKNYQIKKIDMDGNIIQTFGKRGTKNGEFGDSNGMALDLEGNILICDYANRRIQIFSNEGVFKAKFCTNNKRDNCCPSGIAINPVADNIAICDRYNNVIRIFDKTGKFIFQFGSYGLKDAEFDSAGDVIINKTNQNIIVVDGGRIQIFDKTGKFLFKINYEHEYFVSYDVKLFEERLYIVSHFNIIQIYDEICNKILEYEVDKDITISGLTILKNGDIVCLCDNEIHVLRLNF